MHREVRAKQDTGPIIYRIERDPVKLLEWLPEIRALGDSEKEALSFLPEVAYRDAILRRRLIAMRVHVAGDSELAGFIFFGGVFPHARVQQIAVAEKHRRAHVGTALINEVVSQFESDGYLTITAAVAADLSTAQAFYERKGFVARRSVPGGQARKRTIVVRVRDLDTESLLSVLEPSSYAPRGGVDLGLRKRGAGHAPLYVIDVNVLFDIIKSRSRPRANLAEKVIAAALAHQIRLAIAPEFVAELERMSRGEHLDPVLGLARKLPHLSVDDISEAKDLASTIHNIVFGGTAPATRESAQARSDSRHLAQAAIARASCYVTSDSKILAARSRLLREIGIDVASLDDFATLVPEESVVADFAQLKGSGCISKSVSVHVISKYLQDRPEAKRVLGEFASDSPNFNRWKSRAVFEGGEIVGIGAFLPPATIDAPARVVVHVRQDHVFCEIFSEYLLSALCQDMCTGGPVALELLNVIGQPALRRAAMLLGFMRVVGTEAMIKVALGRPVSTENWANIASQTRRRTGLKLPEEPPVAETKNPELTVKCPDGREKTLYLSELEDALGPTILVWPGRSGVIVPIEAKFADDLLGTSNQLSLFGSPAAAFVSHRTYFNTPRAKDFMRPGTPIVFYESKRSGGRGAIIAAARIVDSTIESKQEIPNDLRRRGVVEDFDALATSGEILATTFDNILRCPKPVSLEALRNVEAFGSTNFRTATKIEHASLVEIFRLGWPDA